MSSETHLCKQHIVTQRILLLLPSTMRRESQIRMFSLHMSLRLRAPIKPTGLRPAQVRANLVRRNKLLILIDNRAAKTRFLDNDRREYESGADFHKTDVKLASIRLGDLGCWFVVLGVGVSGRGSFLFPWFAFVDLEDADPDFTVGDGEAHDVVDEGLDFSACLGHAEDLSEELFDHAEVGLLFKGCVEGENGSGTLEAVADEVELFHGVQVLQVHFYCWAIWRLAHPAVEIFAFASFKEEDIVAVVEF